jgi:arylsulfatase
MQSGETHDKKFCRILAVAFAIALCGPVLAQPKKPNILVIWGDDIGYWNLSAYNQGMMGYQTPNIDRVWSDITSGVHAPL